MAIRALLNLAALDQTRHTIVGGHGSSDGTLIPTRNHRCAARSKNYRWSGNAQVLIRRCDRRVLAVAAGGAGDRKIRYITADRSSKASVSATVACWLMECTAASPELVTPRFEVGASFEIERGGFIGAVAHQSSTCSLGSRTGGSYATIVVEDITSPRRLTQSRHCTIFGSNSGITLRPAEQQ
jgi:hypothetical protein